MALKFNPNIEAAPIYIGGSSIAEIQQQYGLEQIIKLASNESPLGPSPLALAAIEAAAGELHRYPPMGDETLRSALAEHLGHDLTPDHIVTGNGGCDILNMLATSFLADGDECLICRPTFPVYDITARRLGATVTYVDLEPEQFTYDVEAILGAISARTRLVYVCSPNNPTGGILTAEQMETLVNNLPPHVILVADEVYYHFVTAEAYPDSLAYVRQGKNVVVLHSFSKAFGLAGLRLGYGVAPAAIARYVSRARLPFHLNSLTVEAGLAGLRDSTHIEQTVAAVVSGRNWLVEQLSRLKLQVWPSQGNFILFKPPFAADQVSERLLEQGLIVRPMGQFYLPTHLRVTVGLPAENERFIAALQKTLEDLEAVGAARAGAVEEDSSQFKF